MKTPAFQFYPQDFLSSPDVQIMTTQEIGAYCLLLFNSWIITDTPGYLPNNEVKLQRLTRLSDKEWTKSKDVILEKFPVSECGTYRYNKRLMEEHEKQKEWKRKSSEAGRRSGEARRNQTQTKTEPTFENGSTLVEPKPNSSFSSSSSSSIAASSKGGNYDIFELFRRQLNRNEFSDTYLRDQARKFVETYKNSNIRNPASLVSSWVTNMKPDIQPKSFVN